MIRFLFRFVGVLCLAAAFILVIYDGTKSIAGNNLYLTSVRALWDLINAGSLAELKPLIQPYANGVLWDPMMLTLLAAPSWRHIWRPWHHPRSARPQKEGADRLRPALSQAPLARP